MRLLPKVASSLLIFFSDERWKRLAGEGRVAFTAAGIIQETRGGQDEDFRDDAVRDGKVGKEREAVSNALGRKRQAGATSS